MTLGRNVFLYETSWNGLKKFKKDHAALLRFMFLFKGSVCVVV